MLRVMRISSFDHDRRNAKVHDADPDLGIPKPLVRKRQRVSMQSWRGGRTASSHAFVLQS
jgi:hypothetical protein